MGPREYERAADADREAIAERLREAAAEGRLDLDEFDDRLGRTYAAKTYGELDRLVRDLPAPPARAAASQVSPRAAGGWLADLWRSWSYAVAICVAIWLLSVVGGAGLHYFWPVWVAVPWGALLLCKTVSGLVTGEPQRWAARRAVQPDQAPAAPE